MNHILPSAQPPIFTEHDEKLERATLGPTEIASAEADLKGLTAGMATLRVGRNKEEEQVRAAGLARLEEGLSKIPMVLKSSYVEATIRCPNLVDDEHKIAFLERDNFDAKLAAERLARYWEEKYALFGPEKCYLPITLMGAMKDDISGLIKYSPWQVSARDASGRAVIFVDTTRVDTSKYSTKSALRALWFMVEAATEDPDVRKRGLVELFCTKNIQRKNFDPEFPRFKKALFQEILPLRCRAMHVCHPNPILYYVIHPIAKYFVGRELRLRLRMHYGSDENVVSGLESYCLPRHLVPSEIGGDLALDIEKWVNDRLVLEGQGSHVATSAQQQYENEKFNMKSLPSKEGVYINSVDSLGPSLLYDLGEKKKVSKKKSVVRRGRHSDPRMNRAVKMKLCNPDMSSYDALKAGGFEVPDKEKTRHLQANAIYDAEGVSYAQHRNQLSRRVRLERNRPVEGGNNHCAVIPPSRNESPSVASEKSFDTAMKSPENDAMCSSEESSVHGSKAQEDAAIYLTCDDEVQSRHERRDSFCDTIMQLPGMCSSEESPINDAKAQRRKRALQHATISVRVDTKEETRSMIPSWTCLAFETSILCIEIETIQHNLWCAAFTVRPHS